ncbi:DUF7003 family protein [Catenulispora rubra]|uniref:DUF7003 family protein n=1 Tax=Catenulispora rubra TaxID=280293 RepID=UPI003F6A3C3D
MSASAIKAQFTQAADNAEFPDFNNGYYYPVDARLRLMRDPERWAMVVELVGCNPRGGNLFDVVHTFGNCLTRESRASAATAASWSWSRSGPYACSCRRTVVCCWPTPPSYTGGCPGTCR